MDDTIMILFIGVQLGRLFPDLNSEPIARLHVPLAHPIPLPGERISINTQVWKVKSRTWELVQLSMTVVVTLESVKYEY